ncbi:MAG TPA: arginine--tRNA ligase [bacterium]
MNLSRHLIQALDRALSDLGHPPISISLEIPPDPSLGDRSSTVALELARQLKKSPRTIAEAILQALPAGDPLISRCEIAGAGYLNFSYSEEALRRLVKAILDMEAEYGSSDIGMGVRRQFEFVSANPTGPLNIVSARAAALGDSLVRLQKKIGFNVESEYYVNDSGKQVELLGSSVQARVREAQGQPHEIPEGGYHGAYIADLAQEATRTYPNDPLAAAALDMGRWAARIMVQQQQRTLDDYGVKFDRWFFESELHDEGRPARTLEQLQAGGHVYLKDGAHYFRSRQFGDDEDRVVVTSDGRPTYFLPDIAYHLHKAERGFKKVYDLWGPDHHGHVQRMLGAMRALDLPEGFLEVIIVQQVNLLRGGQPVKMSKRTGEMITMQELLDEVGADAARQIFLSRRWSSHLDFDIEVAKDRSEKSPVFYVQYAHARIASIFRKAENIAAGRAEDLQRLSAKEELDLIRTLSLFPDMVEAAALQSAPHRLNSYLADLATAFHKFYHECRVLSEDTELTRARLALCRAAQITLREGLRLLGMSAPEQM